MEFQYLVQAKYYSYNGKLEVVNYSTVVYGTSGEEEAMCDKDISDNFEFYLASLDVEDEKEGVLYKVIFEVIYGLDDNHEPFTDVSPLLHREVTEVMSMPEDKRILH